MNTKFLFQLGMSAALLVPFMATASDYPREGDGYYDYAEVTRTEAIARTVRVNTPREECWEEQVPVRESGYTSATPMILGGIIGGVAGHQVGKGRGNDVATVAGTILGGSIGRDVGAANRSDSVHSVAETRCRQVDDYREEQRVEGYRVFYRYNGNDYETRMPHDPGERIRVQVNVQPAW